MAPPRRGYAVSAQLPQSAGAPPLRDRCPAQSQAATGRPLHFLHRTRPSTSPKLRFPCRAASSFVGQRVTIPQPQRSSIRHSNRASAVRARSAEGVCRRRADTPLPSPPVLPARHVVHKAHELRVGEEKANPNVNPLFSFHVRSLLSTFGQAAARRALCRQTRAEADRSCSRLQRRAHDLSARHPQQPGRRGAGAADHAVGPGSLFRQEPSRLQRFSTFNAKAETVSTQPTWREPFKRGRRCLIPAEGFYEWKTLGPKEKQPYAFTGENSLFALAGPWDAWHDKKTDEWLQSFAIITTTPNDLTAIRSRQSSRLRTIEASPHPVPSMRPRAPQTRTATHPAS